jgi:amino acid adenylation domain-containing protein
VTEPSIADAIASHAIAGPARLAIIEDDTGLRLTYGSLDARANHLAHHLRALGVDRDRVVALVLPRSTDLVVGALATIRTGAAYAPFDPSTPVDRLIAMLEDVQPAVVVARLAFGSSLPRGAWTMIALDVDAEVLASGAAPAPELRGAPSDLAYVIYTSGSTGGPKGVEITHVGLLNLVRWHRDAFAVTPADRAPLLASPGFDASVWEMWPYLTAGASLHVPTDITRMDAEMLRDWLVAREITLAFVATPMAERLLALSWPANTRLRTLLTGADTLHRRPPPSLPFRLVNNYGPTEGTVVATSGLVSPDPSADGLPSIGWPITNVRAYVLDERRRLLPAGQDGELYLGGAGVARGYRNQLELTAERFVTDPFEPTGARLYRTGDRVRWQPDGSLMFLGRLDHQVKIRGHRIELDEIVATLDTHPGVENSAVTTQPGPDGEPRLVAFVVAAAGASLSPAALRATLSTRLPDHMLPTVFVVLDALPLTPNGKVDREQLPAAETLEPLRDPQFTAPRTAVEVRLAALVGELLGVHPIGVADNFFLLGGHSLLGTQLIARLRDAFGVELSLRSVFDHPTLEDLALEVERALLPRKEEAA